MGELRRDLGAVGLIGAAVAIFFWPSASLTGAFFVQDVMVQNYPFRHFFAEAIAQGELPLWNAAINCGFPLFAEGQAGPLYPPNILLALLLPTWAALGINIVLHLWLAGVGIYALLRALGAVRVAGLCAGLCYALSGYMVVRAMSPNFIAVCAWVPVLLLLVERSLVRRRWADGLLAAAVFGLQVLAGHPQAAVYGLGAVVAYGVFRGVAQGAGGGFYVALFAAPMLGAGLAAVQWVTTVELVGLSNRGGGLSWQQFVAMSLPPERLASLLLPNIFGNSAHGTYWSRELGFFIQLCAYVGILPLCAAWAALRERRDGPTGFFAALALVGLVLALGHYTAIFALLYDIPGLSFFRIPTRFLLWFALGTAVLCGLGVDQVLRTERQRRASGLGLALGLGALGLGALVANGVDFWHAPADTNALLDRYVHHVRGDVMRLGLVLACGVWLLATKWRKQVAVVAPLVLFLELYSFGANYNGTLDPEVYTKRPATATAIAADRGARVVPPRILSLVAEQSSPFDWHGGWAYDRASYRRYPETLRMYTGGLYGVTNALPGWSPLHLNRHGEFASGYPGFIPLVGIEYLVRYGSGGNLEPIYAEDIGVYRYPNALPRAYMVGQYKVEADPGRRLRYMASRRFDRRAEVVLEREPGVAIGPGGPVRIARYGDEEVAVAIEGKEGGLLVLSDTFYPGWRAYVDGVEQAILQANHVFRAVVVPAGASEVIFTFVPASFRYGLLGSGLAALLWCGLALATWRRTYASGDRPVGARGASLKAWAIQAALVAVLHALATQTAAWMAWVERIRVGVGG